MLYQSIWFVLVITRFNMLPNMFNLVSNVLCHFYTRQQVNS